jgi:hypothetical protein
MEDDKIMFEAYLKYNDDVEAKISAYTLDGLIDELYKLNNAERALKQRLEGTEWPT